MVLLAILFLYSLCASVSVHYCKTSSSASSSSNINNDDINSIYDKDYYNIGPQQQQQPPHPLQDLFPPHYFYPKHQHFKQSPKMSSASAQDIAASCTGQTPFVVNLLKVLYQKGSNLVVSPYSLVSALTMLLPGTEGASKLELVRALFDAQAKEASAGDKQVEVFAGLNRANLAANEKTLAVANLLYSHLNFPLRPEYVQTLTKQFAANAKELDFVGAKGAALQSINGDVEQATKGLIKDLLQDIDPTTRVILVNAIYFKGLWAAQFDKAVTDESGQFHLSSGKSVTVPLMYKKKKFPFYHDEEAKAKFVQLNYKSGSAGGDGDDGGNIAMVFVLPDEGQTLESYISQSFSPAAVLENLDKLSAFDDVNLHLPRFKLASTHQLVTTLQQLGIHEVFGPRADLSRVSPNSEQLYVSDVVQKAVIEVNEEGTEAAAATALMMRMMMLTPEVDFRADRPFLFLLVAKHGDKARQVLFVGAVEDPTKAE